MAMRFTTVVALVGGLWAAACKKKPDATPETGSGSGIAAPAVGSGSAAVAPATPPKATGSTSVGSAVASGSAAPTAGSAAPSGVAADARARELLQHQIDAALKNDHAAFNASFAPDAVVFLPGKGPQLPDDDTSGVLGGNGLDGANTTRSSIAKLTAGGTADAVWFYAEVKEAGDDPKDVPSTTRVVELMVADKGWHVVAASFDDARDLHPSGGNMEVPGAGAPDGPLAKLVAPSQLAAALAPDAILVGPKAVTDIAGLKALEPLAIYKSAREVHTPAYGFVQVTVDHARPGGQLVDRANVQLFAVPNASADKTWRVVLAQYSAQ